MASDSVVQWVKETVKYGVSCSVVEGNRRGNFRDVCTKDVLKLSGRGIELDAAKICVGLKEIKAIESHTKRPSDPAFRECEETIACRLVTLRWNQVGRQAMHGEYAHILFPTAADTMAFVTSMAEVRRYGVRAVLSGKHQKATAEPSEWQIARGRERFVLGRQQFRGRRLCAEPDDAPSAGPIARELGDEDKLDVTLGEEPEMHIRWAEALAEKGLEELTPEELRPLVDFGMPLKYRHMVWPSVLCDAGSVGELLQQTPKDTAKQIELDIPRTQPKWLSDSDRSILRRVLQAYAGRNPKLGYCQGMNFIAMVFILLGFDEDTTYRGLCFIVEEVCPGYHAQGLEGFLRDAEVLGILVHMLLPVVHRQLEAHDIQVRNLAVDHFISLAARVWPLGAVVRIWDMMMIDGTPVVLTSFIAVLELYFSRAVEQLQSQVAAEAASSALRSTSGLSRSSSAPSMTTSAMLDSAEVMEAFKATVMRAMRHELDKILESTRNWLKTVTPRLVEKLRKEILKTEGKSKPSA